MDGVYRSCYAVGCTGKEPETSSIFQGMYVHKIIEPIYVTIYSYTIQPIFGARVRKLPHTDSRVITECSIMHYNESSFFCIVKFSNMTNSELSL